jgi:hypothetical protein
VRVVPVSRRLRKNATYATRESTPIGAARATRCGERPRNGGAKGRAGLVDGALLHVPESGCHLLPIRDAVMVPADEP